MPRPGCADVLIGSCDHRRIPVAGLPDRFPTRAVTAVDAGLTVKLRSFEGRRLPDALQAARAPDPVFRSGHMERKDFAHGELSAGPAETGRNV